MTTPQMPPGLQNPLAWGGSGPCAPPAGPDVNLLVVAVQLSDSAACSDDFGLGWAESVFPALSEGAAASDSIVVTVRPTTALPWVIISAKDSGSTSQVVLAAADATNYGVTGGQQFQMYSGYPTSGGVPATARVNANCSFESGTSPWTAANGASIAQSALHPWTVDGGTHSCAMTPNGSTAAPQIQSELVTISTGEKYVAAAACTPSATWAGGIRVGLVWLNSGTSISTVTCPAVPVTASVQTIAQLPESTPPATANQLQVLVNAVGTPPGTTIFYWDIVYAGLYNALLNGGQVYTITGTSTASGYTTVTFTPPAPSAPVFGTWIEQAA